MSVKNPLARKDVRPPNSSSTRKSSKKTSKKESEGPFPHGGKEREGNEILSKWLEVTEATSDEVDLPPLGETRGMGDVLFGIMPEPDAESVSDVRSFRDRI